MDMKLTVLFGVMLLISACRSRSCTETRTRYSRQAYSNPYTQRYTYSYGCGWWRRCRGTAYRSIQRTSYRSSVHYYTVCCSGYSDSCGGGCQACCSPRCQNGGTCDTPNRCQCRPGWTGSHCQSDINECDSYNRCSRYATCHNTGGSYTCQCKSGFTGNGYSCTDIDECQSGHGCHSNARCINTFGNYSCTCNTGNGRNSNATLILTPRLGNQLGGTPVLVSGLCLEDTDINKIACLFDGLIGDGKYIDRNTALCTTPVMRTTGTVTMTMTIFRGSQNRPTISTTYKNISPVRSHQVKFTVESNTDVMQLYFKPNDEITLSWLPQEVVPDYVTRDDLTNIKVNIQLYQQIPVVVNGIMVSDWVPIKDALMENLNNDGLEKFTIPTGLVMKNCLENQGYICPVAFKVSAVRGTIVNIDVGRDLSNVMLPRRNDVGIWSGVAYLQGEDATGASLNTLCKNWADDPTNQIQQGLLDGLPICPPILGLTEADNRFRKEQMDSVVGQMDTGYASIALAFYHRDVTGAICYEQIIMDANVNMNKQSQQCCYNDQGFLVNGLPGGGSVDKVSPGIDYNMHSINDLLPYVFCCHGRALDTCESYYKKNVRPSEVSGAAEYVFPVPACVFGDPHIVTLDGLKYTFNGKGEFILIETHDNTFTLQGRMEQALDSSGNAAPGTVFTAIAAQQRGEVVSRVVEYQVNQVGGLDVLVDRTRVNFTDSPEQDFQQVMVIDQGNNTVLAMFSGGSSLEIRVENRIISVMLITLPNHYRSLTRGLMGNYNQETSDDLTPRGANSRIQVDSSVEDIFAYGNTWMMDDIRESLFAYNRLGETFEIFRDPFFIPAFEPTFDDVELEGRANEICGDDLFCRFDIAATKDVEIGMSTMMGVRDFDEIVDLAEPVSCDPPCDNGVCVDTDTCFCSAGYSGNRCTERDINECERNVCQNNGTCTQHVRSFNCDCPEGYIGIFCQEKEPPFSIKLINGSPRTTNNEFAVDFTSSKPLRSARCSIIRGVLTDCMLGQFRYPQLDPGNYIFVLIAHSISGERVAERRKIFIGDEESCGVNFINEGLIINGNCVRFQFVGIGDIEYLACKVNDDPFNRCRSPILYCGLELGEHQFQVRPFGNCRKIKKVSKNFKII